MPAMATPEPFCAICTDPPPPGTQLVQRPLGRDAAMVSVCSDCDTLHPRSGRYAFDDGGAACRAMGAVFHGEGSRRTKSKDGA